MRKRVRVPIVTDDQKLVTIPVGGVTLEGEVTFADDATGVVVFAHGSGDARDLARHRLIARQLQRRGLATLLFDLLTPGEGPRQGANVDLLTDRLIGATDWIVDRGFPHGPAIGYFGVEAGVAAALIAAAACPRTIAGVVSQGGRVDLVADDLARVRAPTLLIVGERDETGRELNRQALDRLGGTRQLAIVPGATHLFAERGALATVGRLAASWFGKHLHPTDVPVARSTEPVSGAV